MSERAIVLRCSIVIVFLNTTILAQSLPMATLTGRATAEGAALPFVTVSVASPSLQGTRTFETSSAGDYIFPFLPPGEYTVTFELSGMQTVRRRLTLTAARTETLDLIMHPASMTETITITAETPAGAAIESTQVATNFNQGTIEKLPVGRELTVAALLAPGVNPNGPNGNIMISGAMSFDSLYLVNGAIANENLRGQPHDVFIEDAIQETTVMTGAISAEYGSPEASSVQSRNREATHLQVACATASQTRAG